MTAPFLKDGYLMIRWVVFFSLWFSLLFSDDELRPSAPDQIATFLSDTESLIGGLVNPLSGQFALNKIGLIAKGAQDIVVHRIYNPSSLTPLRDPPPPLITRGLSGKERKKSFREYRNANLQYQKDKYAYWTFLSRNHGNWLLSPETLINLLGSKVILSDSNGSVFEFSVSENGSSLLTPSYGMSNAAGEVPSGSRDPRNIRVVQKGTEISAHFPDGTVRIYTQSQSLTKQYLLQKEILPSGKVIRYLFGGPKHRLYRIESLDPKELYIYSYITIDLLPNQFVYKANSEDSSIYQYEHRGYHEKIKDKTASGSEYKIDIDVSSRHLITAISSPFYRSETLGYNGFWQLNEIRDRNTHCSCAYSGSPYRISCLYFPSGENDAVEQVYTMSYDSPIAGQKRGTTTVTRIDGAKTVYHFSSRILTEKIEWFGTDGNLKKVKCYYWDNQHRLKSVEVIDGAGALFYRKNFEEYDSFGNAELEIFIGNLSGGESLQERTTIRRKYSQDNRNLLLREEYEGEKVVVFQYLPNTNLLRMKCILAKGKIVLREFWDYDDCNNLIAKIADDGDMEDINLFSGVTQRTVFRYRLRQQQPFFHMPEWIEEYYWEKDGEKLLKKTHLKYDKRGHVEEEEVYDANGKFAYAITRTYDEQGNVLSESNPIDQKKTTAEYDPKGRQTLLVSSSERLKQKMRYDLQGRLREVEKIGDGKTRTSKYKYNKIDQCTEHEDSFKNTTTFGCDPISGKVIHAESPPIRSYENTSLKVTHSFGCDSLGREISHTDPNSHTTKTQYNAYGKPILVLHPDGTKEKYTYYLNGNLKQAVDQEENCTTYTYDELDQITSKTITSAAGKELSLETYEYKGTHLIKSTNAGKRKTFYSYDGAGRKITEENDAERTEFEYDELGRLKKTKTINENLTLVAVTEYDLLNRPVEERQEDLLGKTIFSQVFYEYDADGNKSVITRWVADKKAKELFIYDSLNRLIKQEDALGYSTKIDYDEDFRNDLGQRVLKKTHTDPMGLQTIDIYDALDRRSSAEIKSTRTLNLENFYRDAGGNLTKQVSTIYSNSPPTRVVTVWREYDSLDRLKSLTEAYGTSHSKTTRYTYTPRGQLNQTIKPDEVVLERTYDGLGRLTALNSSDCSCSYTYEYNDSGELIKLNDLLTNTATTRMYDRADRLEQETLANGLQLKITGYDGAQRRKGLILPDGTYVGYEYDPLSVKKVSRLDASSNILYSHEYLEQDLGGHLLQQRLIGKGGVMDFTYDLNGRKSQQSHAVVTHRVDRYDPSGNILQLTTVTPNSSHSSEYTYDDLSQLTSEKGVFNHIYSYDSHYNRLEKDGAQISINDLNQIAHEEFRYNSNGCPIYKSGVTYSYDALDRLIEISKEGTSRMVFSYDGLHRRLSKSLYNWANGWQFVSEQRFLYDGQNEIGIVDTAGKIQELRVLGPTPHAEIGAAIALELHSQVYAPLHDLCGNVAFLIKPDDNTPVESYRYTAFGEESIFNPQGDPITNSQVGNSWRYSSKRTDESGLVYYGRRYYDPTLGRWLTPDPAGFADGMNLYAFVLNDPLVRKDLYGLWGEYQPWTTSYQAWKQTYQMGIYPASNSFYFQQSFIVAPYTHSGYLPQSFMRDNRGQSIGSFPSIFIPGQLARRHLYIPPNLDSGAITPDFTFLGGFIGKATDPLFRGLGVVVGRTALSKTGAYFGKIASESAYSVDVLSKAGRALDKGGLTKAGRALMKHGYRKDSVFPKPVGNQTQINSHGQQILELILNHPERKIIHKHVKSFGDVVDIHASGIGGVRFNSSGEMIGFLEP